MSTATRLSGLHVCKEDCEVCSQMKRARGGVPVPVDAPPPPRALGTSAVAYPALVAALRSIAATGLQHRPGSKAWALGQMARDALTTCGYSEERS